VTFSFEAARRLCCDEESWGFPGSFLFARNRFLAIIVTNDEVRNDEVRNDRVMNDEVRNDWCDPRWDRI
jgi:hypothetical protein